MKIAITFYIELADELPGVGVEQAVNGLELPMTAAVLQEIEKNSNIIELVTTKWEVV